MKKKIYLPVILLVVVSGLVFSFAPFVNGSGANREIKNEPPKKLIPKPLQAIEMKAELKKWQASNDGKRFKNWEESTEGKKVQASSNKIIKSIKDYTNMQATVTSLSLPEGSKLGFGIMVNIKGEDFILAFGFQNLEDNSYNFSNEFEQLYRLKVNDKIIIKSHNISKAPKYSFPIISGNYVEKDNKILYERVPRKDGC